MDKTQHGHRSDKTPNNVPDDRRSLALLRRRASRSPFTRAASRLTAGALLTTAGVLGGASAAQASVLGTWDLTGNGRADHWAVEAVEGSGRAALWYWDRNEDGTWDELAGDLTVDGRPDLWSVDADQNGVPEAVYSDLDHDGLPDSTAGQLTASTGSGGMDCSAPDGTVPANVPVYGECAWLQTYATNLGLGPRPWEVMGKSYDLINGALL